MSLSTSTSSGRRGFSRRSGPLGVAVLHRVLQVVALLVSVLAVLVVAGLALGYRPVVITTGSMGDTMPPGALVVAKPVPSDAVTVGDVVVMRRPGQTPVTHRVIELQHIDGLPVAVTQGDANESPDAAPYPLEGDQLTARWSIGGLGRAVTAMAQPAVVLSLAIALLLAGATWALRRVWRRPRADAPAPAPASRRGHTRLGAAVALGTLVATTGLGWTLYRATDAVSGNAFGASGCFEAEVASVQSGTAINGGPGAQVITISAVDFAQSFLLFTVQSASNEPADALVQGRLATPTAIEFLRQTDAGGAPPLTIEWSVIEYRCGVSVQRGVATGNGLSAMDLPIATVDPTRSFVLTSTAPPSTSTTLDGSTFHTAELAAADTIRLRTDASHTLPAAASYAWQVIEFASSADGSVQAQTVALGPSDSVATVNLATPVDPTTTFVLATGRVDATGVAIEDRLIRAHLSSPSTVEIRRRTAGPDLAAHVQVISLADGSTVRHGTVNLASGELMKAITVDPVDPTRATALATVQSPGSASFGNSSAMTDDVLGVASATFTVTDPATVTVTRAVAPAAASWGWQLIEWGGPRWWDPQFPYRQRIDVDTTSDASPNGYSVPLSFDHQALVAANLARADGDDLRVLRWDGSVWTELDRVLDEDAAWDQIDTTIWFQTQDAIAANSRISYWMYYGNPTPPPPLADPENVWLLYEDFESGTLGDFTDRTGTTAWYAADPWTRRLPIAIDHTLVPAAQTGVPVAVEISDPALTAARADGADLRFTTDAGVPLAFEIESWSSATGDLVAWVHLPTISDTVDTSLWLYFGAPDAPDQQDPRALWSAPARGVWHLDRDPVGPPPHADDRSAAHLDGVAVGSFGPGDSVSGVIGPAVDFDGDGDHLELPPPDLAAIGEITLSTWFQADAVGADQTLVAVGDDGDATLRLRLLAGGAVEGLIELDGTTVSTTSSPVAPGAWHHVALVWDGSLLNLHVRGQAPTSVPATGALPFGSIRPLTLGADPGGSQPFDGRLDETRLESVARTAAWLQVAGNNGVAAGFTTWGSVETGTWFDQGIWGRRKPLVIDGSRVTGGVTDFPVLIELTDGDLAAHATASGADIVFTAADGTTRLAHEIEAWDPGTGALTAWVLVPALVNGSDETVYVYFDNPGAIDQQSPHTVFGPEHEGVWHLGG